MKDSKIVSTVTSLIASRLKKFKGREKDFPVNFERRFGRGDDKYLVTVKVWKTPPTFGYTTFFHSPNCTFERCKCSADRQIFFAEYDDKSLAELFKTYNPLVTKGDLPFVLFIQTRADAKHYHVVSPCLLSRPEKIRLMYAAGVSTRYIGFGVSVDRHTLRWARKDKRKFQLCYVSGMINSNLLSGTVVQAPLASEAHLEFMKKVYNIPDSEFETYRKLPCTWFKGKVEIDRYYATNFMKKGAKEK